MRHKRIFLLLIIISILTLSGCKNEENNFEETEKEFISCLNSEMKDKLFLEGNISEISLDKITKRKDQISFYEGYYNNDSRYILYSGQMTYEYDLFKDFYYYFANNFKEFQYYDVGNGVFIMSYFKNNDIDYKDIINKCKNPKGESNIVKVIPRKTRNKIADTKKIKIKVNDKEKVIDDEKKIKEVIEIINNSYQELGNAYLCDGYAYDFKLYDKSDKLIDTIFVWPRGSRVMPESLSKGCVYYNVKGDKSLIDVLKDELEISDYRIMLFNDESEGKKDLIYKDKKYKYYIKNAKNNEVFLVSNKTNKTILLSKALESKLITIEELEKIDQSLEIEKTKK